MTRLLALACLAPVLLVTPALAQSGGGGQSGQHSGRQLSEQDKKWLDYAATDNQGEIEASLLAEKQAQSLALRAFVRLMVDDHVEVESRLAALVSDLGVSVPNGPGQDNQKKITELQSLHGQQFDQRFMAEQIKDHSDDIRKFSDEAQSTSDAEIRRYALETLPILKQHLALAKAVQSSLGQSDEPAEAASGSRSGALGQAPSR